MTSVSGRLRQRIERDFPETDTARAVAALVDAGGETERVQAAIVLSGRGNVNRICEAQALALTDWRDLLVGVGLADDDWPRKLDAELGSGP